MPNVKITNMLNFYTLCLLAHGPKHGYELIKELEPKLGRKISASNVYPFLSSLRKNKLIKFDKIGNRDKKVYHLTQEGRKFTHQMFNKFGDLINIAIEPRLAVCPCGCKIYSGGHAKKVRGKLMKFCCSHCAKNYNGK
ncbi:PadR family transcriptional regulator [Candidatus Woesearchaeota archaeon]|nr:PadR family transcriptional regulator [Candidatus Woesearchaeota archaeon]